MAHMNAHGGGCCGMRHIHSMTLNEMQSPTQLRDSIIRFISSEDGGRLFEVVLNERQMSDGRILDILRRFGFVLVSSFHNRTGSPCAIFHRADRRLPLTRWRNRWQGMVINANMQGHLPIPRLQAATAPQRPISTGAPVRRDTLRPGDTVIVNNTLSPYHGHSGRVLRVHDDAERNVTIRFNQPVNVPGYGLRQEGRTAIYNLRSHAEVPAPQPNNPAPAPAPEFPVHQNADIATPPQQQPEAPVPQPTAPEPAPVTPVLVLYHNVLRSGRSLAGWPTWQNARDVAPRVQQIDARVIYSDGNIRWFENVRGPLAAAMMG